MIKQETETKLQWEAAPGYAPMVETNWRLPAAMDDVYAWRLPLCIRLDGIRPTEASNIDRFLYDNYKKKRGNVISLIASITKKSCHYKTDPQCSHILSILEEYGNNSQRDRNNAVSNIWQKKNNMPSLTCKLTQKSKIYYSCLIAVLSIMEGII